MTLVARLITLKCLYILFYLPIHKGFSLVEKMMIEDLAMQYLTRHLVVSSSTINRFHVAEGMEELIRDLFIDLNLRLKMEELATLDCLFFDRTKIEANSNKYSFVWKKAIDKIST